ncbi:MAG: hypothetical protein IT290_10060 [Deltaproteobacteria bacterium]|nr:hypothetical protein [Deltaproteobacteria bacterium]
MALKFRLKGLAETFVERIHCPHCGHDGGSEGDSGFRTDYTRVTYNGIVVVIECEQCGEIFVPTDQRCGIINSEQLRDAVERDSVKTGGPVFQNLKDVHLDVERLNAIRNSEIH